MPFGEIAAAGFPDPGDRQVPSRGFVGFWLGGGGELVTDILPAGRTVGSLLADRVTGFARRGRRQGDLPGPGTRT
jgi:hypothetical protein